MIRTLRYSELARALGMSNASISMALKNKTLQSEEEEKLIDIERPINKLWINNQIAAGREFNLAEAYARKRKPRKITKEKEKIIVNKDDNKKENKEETKEIKIKEYKKTAGIGIKDEGYIQKKKNLELKKLKQTVKLDELRIKKIQGELIPYDAVKTVFLYAVETFRNTYGQEADALSNIFIKRLGGEHKHFIELQKELMTKINDIQIQVKEDLLQGLKGIQAEYQEVRGRGERK